MQTLSVARLFEDERQELQLEQLTESLASSREITLSDVHRPGMALMGFVENFLPERIQILAQTELTYLATLKPEAVRAAIDRLFQFEMPLIVVCKGLEVPPHLIQLANQHKVPVLRTTQSTTPFIHSLTAYLDYMFAPTVSEWMNGVVLWGVRSTGIEHSFARRIRCAGTSSPLQTTISGIVNWNSRSSASRTPSGESVAR